MNTGTMTDSCKCRDLIAIWVSRTHNRCAFSVSRHDLLLSLFALLSFTQILWGQTVTIPIHAFDPSSIGSTGNPTTPASPICLVDGVVNQNIASCITYLNSLGVTGTGTIISTIPEDFTSNIFAANNFTGLVLLSNSLGSSGTCSTTAPFNCWMTEVPLIVGSHLQIRGSGTSTSTNTKSGTVISFGSSFPQAVGVAPPNPTSSPGCSSVPGGQLPNGTYRIVVGYVNNLMGGSSSPVTPGRGIASAEVMSTCSAGGTGQIKLQVPNLPEQGSGYGVQELVVYITAPGGVGGSELEAGGSGGAAGVTCSTNMGLAGVIDGDGGSCQLNSSMSGYTGTILINAVSTFNFAPPIVDLTNPMIVLSSLITAGGDKNAAFDSGLRDLTLNCGSGTSINTPAVAVFDQVAQEQSGADGLSFEGGCLGNATSSGTFIYSGFSAGNSHVTGATAGSSTGPGSGTFYDFICDGRGNAGCARWIADATFAARCSGCSGSTEIHPAAILITGIGAAPQLAGIHMETSASGSATGGDGIQVSNGARVLVGATSGVEASGKAMVHIMSGAGAVCAFSGNEDGNNQIQDDTIVAGTGNCNSTNSYCINNGTKVSIMYCNQQQTGLMTLSQNLVFGSSKGQHINTQAAGNDIDGSCSISSGTSCAISFSNQYASAPVCTCSPSATAAGVCAPTTVNTSGATFSVPTSGSYTIYYHCLGSPN